MCDDLVKILTHSIGMTLMFEAIAKNDCETRTLNGQNMILLKRNIIVSKFNTKFFTNLLAIFRFVKPKTYGKISKQLFDFCVH